MTSSHVVRASPPAVTADDAHGARHRGPVGQHRAAPPAREILGADPPLDLNLVDARDLVARMEEAVAELAVIGEQEQALGVEVEATDGEQPLGARGQEIDHNGPALGIAPARHVTARLVQEHVAMRGNRGQRPPVDGDDVALGIGLRAGLAPDLAVDADAAGAEERLSPAARAQSPLGQDLADANRWQR